MKSVLGSLALAVAVAGAAGSAWADGAEINRRLGRGINMGNMLEAPAEGEWGVTLDEREFARIAGKGFDSVRIPIRWSARGRLGGSPPYAIDPVFLQRVEKAVTAALDAKLAVVINFHHYDELIADPEGQHDRFLAAWRQVSAHFQSYPDSLVFEVLNEPNGKLTASRWNVLLAEALAVIRATNPSRAVVIGTAEWGGVGALTSLALPANDRNLILTVHYYSPFRFTHQGASWAGAQAQDWLGTTWDGTYAEKLAVRMDLQAVKDYADAAGIPVYIGEFGAFSTADMASRARWTAYCACLFEDMGFSWSYWEYCGGFGAFDPEAKAWRQPLVEALLSDERSVLEMGQPPGPRDTRTNLVQNGDFADGMDAWTFGAWQGQATGAVEAGVFTVRIENPSTESWHIQLLQDGLAYHDATVYEVTCEAWADQERTVGISAQNSKDYTTFGSMTAPVSTDPRQLRFRFVKVGDEPDGRISFSFGAEKSSVHLRHIRVVPVPFDR